jgi:cytochrome c
MSRFASFAAALLCAGTVLAQPAFPGIGRTATPAEIRAWDIDVRPDFRGLPKGAGSVKQGEEIWEAKCASCHGTFGESNAVFAPIAGGTTPADIAQGRVAALTNPDQGRTMLMKLSQVSALWDYINRAMPWNAPKSLSVNEVYATVAYILNLGYVVPEDFVLSDANIAETQRRLPNRNDMTRAHGLWDVSGKPDVSNVACMKDCPVDGRVISQLPDYARAAHGNLADQNRLVGPVRGVTTASIDAFLPAQAAATRTLAEKSGCLACHGISAKVVGPALHDIAAKYKSDGAAESRLAGKVKSGSQGAWGPVPMPPNSHVADDDIRALVKWILGGAG